MRVDRVALRLLVGLALVAATAACRPGPGHPPGTGTRPTSTTRPPATKVLVQWDESGGHCMETCPEEHVTITATGSWSATRGPVSTSGQLSESQLRELTQQIRSGLASLRRLPPSTGCPSHYDGRDIEIDYAVDNRSASVSNCDQDFEGNELIAYTTQVVDRLLGADG